MANMSESEIKLVTFFAAKLEEERQIRKAVTEDLKMENSILKKELDELKTQIKILNVFISGIGTIYEKVKEKGREDPQHLPPFE